MVFKIISEIIVEHETAGNVRLVPADPITDPIAGPVIKPFAYRNDSICFFRKVYLHGSGHLPKSNAASQGVYSVEVLQWSDKDLADLTDEQQLATAPEIKDVGAFIENRKTTISSLLVVQKFDQAVEMQLRPLYAVEIVKITAFENTVKPSLRILIENPSRNLEDEIKSFGEKVLVCVEKIKMIISNMNC